MLAQHPDECVTCVYANAERNPRPILVGVSGSAEEFDCAVQSSLCVVGSGDSRDEISDGFIPGQPTEQSTRIDQYFGRGLKESIDQLGEGAVT